VRQLSPALEAVQNTKDAGVEKGDEKSPKRVFHMSAFVRAGGALLALCAGIVNATAFYSQGTFVSHVTGTLAKVSIAVEDSSNADLTRVVFILISFVSGSTLTGFLIAKDTMHFGLALYDICLLSECAFLVVATLTHEEEASAYFAAAACGLQNAMCTHWGGAVVRTTHVTGLCTDVGLLLGRMLSTFCRKRCGKDFDDFDRMFVADDVSKLSALFTIALCFLGGVKVGAHLYNAIEHYAFLIPAAITGGIGVAYSTYRVKVLHHSLFSTEEMEAIDVPVTGFEHQPTDEFGLDASTEVYQDSKYHSGYISITREEAGRLEEGRERGASHDANEVSPMSPKSPSLPKQKAKEASFNGNVGTVPKQ